jgi:hypothetical protein
MDESLRERLKIPYERLDEINAVLLDPDERVVNDVLAVVEKYGSPEEINAKAEDARKLPNLLKKVEATNPAYLEDLKWLEAQRDAGAFISVADYRRKVLGDKADTMTFADDFAVTLEISAC